VGKVRLDQKARSISFAGKLNMKRGLLEYLLVHSRGSVHESLLVTEVEASDIHVALLLLGAKGGAVMTEAPPAQLIELPGEIGACGGELLELVADVQQLERDVLELETIDLGKPRRLGGRGSFVDLLQPWVERFGICQVGVVAHRISRSGYEEGVDLIHDELLGRTDRSLRQTLGSGAALQDPLVCFNARLQLLASFARPCRCGLDEVIKTSVAFVDGGHAGRVDRSDEKFQD
jgi:hypothetical protein